MTTVVNSFTIEHVKNTILTFEFALDILELTLCTCRK